MLRHNKRLVLILASALSLLLLPFIAMQISSEINWTTLDFVVMGVLLLATGLLCEMVMRMKKSIKTRVILCSVVLLVFLVTWMELAVGLLGTSLGGS